MTLRVYQVVTKLAVGGAQRAALSATRSLQDDGVDVVLVAGTEVDEEGSLRDEVDRLGLRFVAEPALVRRVSPINDVRAVWRLTRLFRRERPIVVHAHSSKAGVIARLAAWLARTPVVAYSVHGWAFEQRSGRIERAVYRALERALAHVTDHILVVTASLERDGLAVGVGRPDQYRVIRAGEDLRTFEAAAHHRAEGRAALPIGVGDVPLVGTVTRLSDPKDPFTTVRAMTEIDDAHLVVVGDGPLRPDVERLIAQLDLGDRVHLLGSRDDVPDLLGGFDVFVLNSRSESLPLSIVEALAAGVPVVASDVGGVHEVVRPGITGELVPVADVSATAGAVRLLLSTSGRREGFDEAVAGIVEEFDDHTLAAKLRAAYGHPDSMPAPS